MKYNDLQIEFFSDTLTKRFWSHVSQDVVGCWLWTGNKTTSNGHTYGLWSVNGQAYKPHRVAYLLTHGSIDNSLTIDHLCNNKLCCRPDHLELVTQSENTKRQFRKPDRLYSLTCPHGHPRVFGDRHCRPCLVIRVAACQKRNYAKYREMKRLQKRKERERRLM